jgi:hypothetical protein
MDDHPDLPRLADSLTIYRIVCDVHPQAAVSAEDVRRHAGEAVDDVVSLLDMLVAYGLLDRSADGYTPRCRPADDLDRWRHQGARRAEVLYEAVHGGDTVTPRLRARDRTYTVVEVEADDTLDTVSDRLATAATSAADTVGVALTTPAEAANELQRLVDDIERTERFALEMADTEVVETNSGLRSRSYLERS